MTLSMPPVLFAFPFVLFVFAAPMLDNLRVFFSSFSTFPSIVIFSVLGFYHVVRLRPS